MQQVQRVQEGAFAGAGDRRESREQNARERLLRLGAQALGDAELLEVLLAASSRAGRDLPVWNESLLSIAGGLKGLLQQDAQTLCGKKGLGRARAVRLLAAVELGRRVIQSAEQRPRLRSPEEVFRYLSPKLGALRREVFHVLCFNARNVLLHDARVAEGSVSACPVDPREVFSPALTCRATAIVLAHNHPSGDPEPSVQDVSLTAQLARGAELLGLRVLDHLVLGDGRYVSLQARGQELSPRAGGMAWERGGL